MLTVTSTVPLDGSDQSRERVSMLSRIMTYAHLLWLIDFVVLTQLTRGKRKALDSLLYGHFHQNKSEAMCNLLRT